MVQLWGSGFTGDSPTHTHNDFSYCRSTCGKSNLVGTLWGGVDSHSNLGYNAYTLKEQPPINNGR
jgi:hypothetical protein